MSKLVVPDDVVVPPQTPYLPASVNPGSGEFEFADSDNETFRGLSSAMRFVGVMSIVFGVLEVLGGLVAGINLRGMLTLGQGALLIVIGAWLCAAAGSLRDVATTEGNDVMNLMYALRKLKSVFTLQAWLMGLACALLITALAVAVK